MATNTRTPDRFAYTVTKASGDKKDFWCRVGAGWINKDGSISVKLNALPVNGQLVLQIPKEGTDEQSPE